MVGAVTHDHPDATFDSLCPACTGALNGELHPPGFEPAPYSALMIPGGAAVLDTPETPVAVWGDRTGLAWADGEALVIAAPDGCGKTTLGGLLVRARLGVTRTVLGMPVTPGTRRVLYLAMDRPWQARRALSRQFTEEHRDLLDHRFLLWPGPPPRDLARHTDLLTQLCEQADADTVVVDSLKDAALKLSDDEGGSGWNRARQTALQAGVQVIELHHPRKAQDGNRKPNKLDDLYGSRLIAAGAGSVLSLWGEAGDPITELTHLKPAGGPAIGPWSIIHDFDTGEMTLHHGIDLLEQAGLRGTQGITAEVAARLLFTSDKPSRNEIEKARRKLAALEKQGLLLSKPGTRGGDATTWYRTAQTG